jgi:hypothetical protein
MTSNVFNRLVALAESLGVQDEDLDSAVHEMVQESALDKLNSLDEPEDQEEHIEAGEHRASEINNRGLPAQIAFLLEHLSEGEVEQVIRQAGTNVE